MRASTRRAGNFCRAQPVCRIPRDGSHLAGRGRVLLHANNADWQNPDDTRDFPGRYKALKVSLQGITINPTIAVRPIPELSFGAAGSIWRLASLELIRALALGGADARIALAGNTVGVGGNIGVLARLLDGLA